MKTRLTSARDQHESSTYNLPVDLEATATGAGKGCRPPADVAEHLQGPTFVLDKRCKRDALRVASVADKGAVKGYAQWRNSELKPQVDASRSSAAEEAEAAISAWVADECSRVSGEKLSESEAF